MRPNIVRAITAALATVGTAWAIALPTLTLGDAKSPPHTFAVPAADDDLVIVASRPPDVATAIPVPPVTPSAPSPRVPPEVGAGTPARSSAPAASPAPAPQVPVPVPAAFPKPLPVPPEPAPAPRPTPEATPVPEPQPESKPVPEPAPEPPAERTLASVAPVASQPDEPEPMSKKHKQKDKDKKDKKDKKFKERTELPQHEAPPPCEDEPAVLPQAEQAVAVGPLAAVPVESLPAVEVDQDEIGKHGHDKEHPGHGKEHDKKK